eukprot:TRINITY_DN36256_c0_g1_i1.p1 TRINITY_DN36256_c0_g1~~TRINITY_DN36256_c0_g1_i1.p1  ORF type:complete len:202 (+),score=71.86 TRINITY_DN36256_c0_g1_i1:146-751(+)
MPPKFILGSSSKWRKNVLQEAMPELEVHSQMSPDIDEKAIRHDHPETLCLSIARAKAEALKPAMRKLCTENPGTEYLLLTADQVVKHEGAIREKPESPEENYAYLKSYTRDAPLCTCSAISVTHFPSERSEDGVDVVQLSFDGIPDDVIRETIAKGDTMTCCGGFTIEDLHPYAVDLRPEDMPSIRGMPVGLLRSLTAKLA